MMVNFYGLNKFIADTVPNKHNNRTNNTVQPRKFKKQNFIGII